MKQLGPHRKYVILAIVIQSIVVILLGYYLFKSRADKAGDQDHGEVGNKEQTVVVHPCGELRWPHLRG